MRGGLVNINIFGISNVLFMLAIFGWYACGGA